MATTYNTTPRTLAITSFGDFSRFGLVEFLTRFGDVTYMVTDAERIDDITGGLAIVAQETGPISAIFKAVANA